MKSYLLIALLAFAACGKDNAEISQENIDKSETFKVFVRSGAFHLTEYYSVEPIDYNGDGETETDLWPYVSEWLFDDAINFAGENVSIVQGEIRIPNDNSEAIVRPYAIQPDSDGVYMDFLSHEYLPLRYRLVEFTSSSFIVYASWEGKTVYSKFERLL